MPAWRIPPPTTFRQRLALFINASEPNSIEPIGAPRPFDKQIDIESTCWQISVISTFNAVAAL